MFEISTADEFQKLLTDFPYVVIDVYADWCMPCKMSGPRFEETSQVCLSHFPQGTIVFVKLNVERNLLRDISSLPTFLIYHQGKLVQQYTGVNGTEDIKKFFQALLPQELNIDKASDVGKKKYKTFGSL